MNTTKIHNFRLAIVAALVIGGTKVATAGTVGAGAVGQNAFDAFRDTVVGWAQGPLGVGLSVTMCLMGAGYGVAKNSPMPALSGIAGAAILNWVPGIIGAMQSSGALV